MAFNAIGDHINTEDVGALAKALNSHRATYTNEFLPDDVENLAMGIKTILAITGHDKLFTEKDIVQVSKMTPNMVSLQRHEVDGQYMKVDSEFDAYEVRSDVAFSHMIPEKDVYSFRANIKQKRIKGAVTSFHALIISGKLDAPIFTTIDWSLLDGRLLIRNIEVTDIEKEKFDDKALLPECLSLLRNVSKTNLFEKLKLITDGILTPPSGVAS